MSSDKPFGLGDITSLEMMAAAAKYLREMQETTVADLKAFALKYKDIPIFVYTEADARLEAKRQARAIETGAPIHSSYEYVRRRIRHGDDK